MQAKRKRKDTKVFCSFLRLVQQFDDVKQFIDHIDMNKINNNLSNLRIVNNQQNSFNTNAKGYTWRQKVNKYQANIRINNKLIHLGLFTTEKEARQAYLDAKLIYHII